MTKPLKMIETCPQPATRMGLCIKSNAKSPSRKDEYFFVSEKDARIRHILSAEC